MISHSCENVLRMQVMKKVWSSSLKKSVDYSFLCWNLSDNYNFEMNDNDIPNQLWLVYHIMRFQRNKKWWWALFLWGYEVSLVNSYVAMKQYCELKGVPVKWMHHDWNEAIAYTHINPNEYWPRAKSLPKIVDLDVTVAKEKSHKMDSLALSVTRGWLRRRLNGSVTHMPVLPDATKSTTVCQLHQWAYKEFNQGNTRKNPKPAGLRSQVMHCRAFKVDLCLRCWEIFHTQERL
jgi:hypothetical protein